jgi:hypothetical protein
MPKILIYATDGNVPPRTRPEMIAAYDLTVDQYNQLVDDDRLTGDMAKLCDDIRQSLGVAEVMEGIIRKGT